MEGVKLLDLVCFMVLMCGMIVALLDAGIE